MSNMPAHYRGAAKFQAITTMVGNAVGNRPIILLRKIEETIDAVLAKTEEMKLVCHVISDEIGRLTNEPTTIDPTGEIVRMLETARDRMPEIYAHFTGKWDAAKADKNLHDDDGVVYAYCELMETTANLHNALNDLCWAVGEHDADLDKTALGSFNSAEELFAAMGV